MYVPRRFEQPDADRVREIIRTYAFSTVVTMLNGETRATHIPLEFHTDADGTEWLYGHVALSNPQRQALEASVPVLAIFLGPHAYVSPSWYDRMNVPTWNYAAVHVYGTSGPVTDPEEFRRVMTRMIERYEPAGRYTIDSMTREYFDQEARALFAFKVRVEKMEAAFKLSQNRHARDYENIIVRLKETGEPGAVGVARLMEDNRTLRKGM
jgi:transcriptional regulator